MATKDAMAVVCRNVRRVVFIQKALSRCPAVVDLSSMFALHNRHGARSSLWSATAFPSGDPSQRSRPVSDGLVRQFRVVEPFCCRRHYLASDAR
jgi:hypothetical protein